MHTYINMYTYPEGLPLAQLPVDMLPIDWFPMEPPKNADPLRKGMVAFDSLACRPRNS